MALRSQAADVWTFHPSIESSKHNQNLQHTSKMVVSSGDLSPSSTPTQIVGAVAASLNMNTLGPVRGP